MYESGDWDQGHLASTWGSWKVWFALMLYCSDRQVALISFHVLLLLGSWLPNHSLFSPNPEANFHLLFEDFHFMSLQCHKRGLSKAAYFRLHSMLPRLPSQRSLLPHSYFQWQPFLSLPASKFHGQFSSLTHSSLPSPTSSSLHAFSFHFHEHLRSRICNLMLYKYSCNGL